MAGFGALLGPSGILVAAVLAAIAGAFWRRRACVEAAAGGDPVCAGDRRRGFGWCCWGGGKADADRPAFRGGAGGEPGMGAAGDGDFHAGSRAAGERSRAAGPEKPLVVAARALPLGSMLARDAVKLRSVPEKLFPSGGFSRLEDVLDRPVISPIQAEEPVLEARIAARGSGVGLRPMIPPGMRAISVRVNDVVGVAGFVLPGMRVDVLVTGQAVDAAGHSDPHGAAEHRGAVGGADDPDGREERHQHAGGDAAGDAGGRGVADAWRITKAIFSWCCGTRRTRCWRIRAGGS